MLYSLVLSGAPALQRAGAAFRRVTTMQQVLRGMLGHSKILACGLVAGTVMIGSVAPASAQMGPREGEGTAAGAIMGGIIGGLIGGHGGAAVGGAIAGTIIGGMIGNRIGAQLDAEDRAWLDQATRVAIRSGKSQRRSNKKTGVKMRAQVVSSQKVDGKPCRTIKQEVVLKDGNVVNDTVSACRGPNGWEV
jgi:surface antigen